MEETRFEGRQVQKNSGKISRCRVFSMESSPPLIQEMHQNVLGICRTLCLCFTSQKRVIFCILYEFEGNEAALIQL